MEDSPSPPPLASILVRFAAVLLDGIVPSLIFLPLGLVSAFVLSPFLAPTPGAAPALPGDTTQIVVIFLVLLTYLGLASYSALVLAMWANGLTPGKWMLGLQVVRRDTEQPASFWRMALRQIVGQWVSAILCYLGFLWAAFDANRQGWHDKIAKTLVVRTR